MNDLNQQFSEISDRWKKEIVKARRRGMTKAATKIKSKTKKLYKQAFNHSNNGKYSDNIEDGARVSKYKESSYLGEAITGAHVMGVRNSGSGTFRLRFFENGTVERKTKKGFNRGSISAKGLFKSSVSQELPKAKDIIEQELNKAIDKLNE